MNDRNYLSVTYTMCCATLIAVALSVFQSPVNAQGQSRPNLEGTWIEGASDFRDPRWRLRDLVCYGCTRGAYELLDTMLAQEEELSRSELAAAMVEFDRNLIDGLLTEAGREYTEANAVAPDPGCQLAGLIEHLRSRLSIKIEEYEDRIVFEYEYLGPVRTVYMDGRDHPAEPEPSLLGHSIGWYDGPTLVVETKGLQPSLVRSSGIVDPIRISERALVIERYTRHEGDEWYDYEATLVDPRMYREPFVIHHQRRLLELDPVFEIYDCQVVSGER